MMEEQKDLTEYYKQLYDMECEKNDQLVAQLEEAEKHIEELDYKLGRIKNSFAWKLSKPLRMAMHTYVRIRDVYRQYGSPVGVARKLRLKMRQKNAQKQHGLASFPNAEERRRQEETVFPKDVTFSILVPLYNTPEKFLREMIASVQAQTYGKWELCLADGSDDAHAQVGEICREIAAADPRVKYKKIEKNLGISGNTNVCFGMATGNFIGLFDHDDLLHPSVLYEYMKVICEQDADYIYCDEVTFEGDSIDNMLTIHFKPDFSIDNLVQSRQRHHPAGCIAADFQNPFALCTGNRWHCHNDLPYMILFCQHGNLCNRACNRHAVEIFAYLGQVIIHQAYYLPADTLAADDL